MNAQIERSQSRGEWLFYEIGFSDLGTVVPARGIVRVLGNLGIAAPSVTFVTMENETQHHAPRMQILVRIGLFIWC